MKLIEYRHLLAERKAVERMLADTPEDFVIDRGSMAARLAVVQERIDAAVVDERDPGRMVLTFRGKPVVGERGIFADFGTKAVGDFSGVIATLAAAAEVPVANRGPVPKRDQNQLLITATAHGSFGFVLEEHHIGQLRLGEETPTLRALGQAHTILQSTLGTDDELADAVAEVPLRAMESIRSFFKTLVDAEASCAVDLGGKPVRFDSVARVAQALERIRQDNLVEAEEQLHGALIGVLPVRRHGEFELAPTKEVVSVRFALDVPDLGALNERLHEQMTIRVRKTTVGKGRPRYVVLEVPAAQ